MSINHLYNLQYLYMINVKFTTFSYLKPWIIDMKFILVNHGIKNHIYMINKTCTWSKWNLIYYHTWKPYLLWKPYIHNHVFINHAYISHSNKSHVWFTILYSCSNHDSKYNRTRYSWKYIQVWEGFCLIKQKLIEILIHCL